MSSDNRCADTAVVLTAATREEDVECRGASNFGAPTQRSRSVRRSRKSVTSGDNWINLSPTCRTQFAIMRMIACENLRRPCDDDTDGRRWYAVRETLIIDRDIREINVAFAEWQPRLNATDVVDTIVDGGGAFRSSANESRSRVIRYGVNLHSDEYLAAVRRFNGMCLNSLTYVISRCQLRTLVAAMRRHRETRLALAEGTSALRLDSIHSIDNDPIADETALDQTIRVERTRAGELVERRHDEASSVQHVERSISSKSALANQERTQDNSSQRRIEIGEYDRAAERERGLNERTIDLTRTDNVTVELDDNFGKSDVNDATAAMSTLNTDVSLRGEFASTTDRQAQRSVATIGKFDRVVDTSSVDVANRTGVNSMATDGVDATLVGKQDNGENYSVLDERTVSVTTLFAGGGQHSDVEESRAKFRSSARESIDYEQRVESLRSDLNTNSHEEITTAKSNITRKRTLDDRFRDSTGRTESTADVSWDNRADFDDVSQHSLPLAKRQRLMDSFEDQRRDNDSVMSKESDAAITKVGSKRARDVTNVESDSAAKRRAVEIRGDATSTFDAASSRDERSFGASAIDNSVDRETSRSNDVGASNVILRRRCRSVLQRVLLSNEYRRAHVRQNMRYEELMSRIAIACETLEPSSRCEADRIFNVARTRYIGSLYEISRVCFMQHAVTASAMIQRVKQATSFWTHRGRADMSVRTHDWLLRRVVDEYARARFFQIYEYTRSFELYKCAQQEFSTNVTHDTSVIGKNILADVISKLKQIVATPISVKDRTIFVWLRNTIRIIHACVRTVECVCTLKSQISSGDVNGCIFFLENVVSTRGILDATWDTIDTHANRSSTCRRVITPVWNLLLDSEQETNGATRNNARSQNAEDDMDTFNRIVERDEYFDMYRLLSSCDRNNTRNDAIFYVGIFERLCDKILSCVTMEK